jgi:hypothetical protein
MGTKMGTVISVALDRFYTENVSYISRYWNEASPEKAGVGGSIPSLAPI